MHQSSPRYTSGPCSIPVLVQKTSKKKKNVVFPNLDHAQLGPTHTQKIPTDLDPPRTVQAPNLVQDGRLQFHIARLVHAMHVAEGRSNGEETIGHFAQGVIDLENFLGGRHTKEGLMPFATLQMVI